MFWMRLRQSGEFEGEFTVQPGDADTEVSIGDYLEVRLLEPAVLIDVKPEPPSKITKAVQMKLRVLMSAQRGPLTVFLSAPLNFTATRWLQGLTVGLNQIVIARQLEYQDYTFWVPEIDGKATVHRQP